MFDSLCVAVTVYWRPLGSLVDPEAVWTRSRWTEQQSQQHDSAAPVCLDPAVSTRHHDSTQNPNTHTETERDAAAAGQLSLKLLFFFFFWGFKRVVIQQIHCRTWELMDWRSSSDGSHTRTWTWKSFKVFYKTKTWSLQAILSSLLHFIDLINLTC